MEEEQQELREYQREYLDFLDDNVSPCLLSSLPHPYLLPHPLQEDQGVYQEKVREMIRGNSHRLIVNINDLRRKNAKRAAKLLNESQLELLSFQVCWSHAPPLQCSALPLSCAASPKGVCPVSR